MIVITLNNCPPKVRGDLSKWLFEINTGVFVGNLSARVRDELWERICENIKQGQATMVYSNHGEQKIDFRVHNTTWEPVDFEGIKLMRKPLPRKIEQVPKDELGFSKAAKMQKLKRINAKKPIATAIPLEGGYVVFDVETTGLVPERDRIIEIAGLKIENGKEIKRFSALIKHENHLPYEIVKLTGITDKMLAEQGINCKEALEKFVTFVGGSRLVGHNVAFDYSFLRAECRRNNIKMLINPTTDTLVLAKKYISGIKDYKLDTLAEYFNLTYSEQHRAVPDCVVAHQLLLKLMEFSQ